jgi:hypothetical protein
MSHKLSIGLLTAIAAFSIGSVYAADDKAADKAQSPGDATSAPAVQPSQKPLSKQEALKQGIPESVFNKADLNHDGQLDQQEINAYNAAHPK